MFRWALLSNTTISPLVQRLRNELQAVHHACEFFGAEYGDAQRQVFSGDSELYLFKPDLVVLHLDLQQIKPHLELSFPFENAGKRDEIMAEVVEHVVTTVATLRSRTAATLLVSNFAIPGRSVLGVGLDHLLKSALRRANLEVEAKLRLMPQCHVFDCDGLWAEAGWSDRDRRFEAIAQMPLGPKIQKLFVAEWLRYYRALEGLSRKCVVLDLDNTLWKGVLGEDGADGIRMGDTPEGRSFRQFQLALKALNRRGVILAICSKNSKEEATEVIRNHPDMVLRDRDFAAMQINWEDKASNLARIAGELNIGLRHVVFLDDSPTEREWVREKCPEVLVPEMPRDSSGFCDVLAQCELDTLVLTEEDSRRTQMYQEDRQRRDFQAETPSYEQFLQELKLEADIQAVQPQLLERATQLCQRTNQFNLTTRRYTSEQIKLLIETPGVRVLMTRVRDRFGDYGWSGLAVARVEKQSLTIDSFLLSCRVLGKNVEYALLAALVQWGAGQGCIHIQGAFIPTGKNLPCAGFYAKCGMTARDSTAVSEQWFSAQIAELPALPVEHISVSTNDQRGRVSL